MKDPAEIYKSVLDTWRFQVNSYWQRSWYFAALETVAMAGFWKLVTDPAVPRYVDAVFGTLGLSLTVVWWLSNRKTHEYVEHWWQSLLELEARLELRQEGTDYATRIEARQKSGLRYRYLVQVVPVLFFLAWSFLLGLVVFQIGISYHSEYQESQHPGYFDAHNHSFSGILPYYAYADLNAFIADPTDPAKVDLEHRRELWKYLVSNEPLGKSPLTGPANRFAPGAIATLRAYGTDIPQLTAQQINGALQRVLTSTPWTEFDSAYAFRGAPVEGYLSATFGHDITKMNKALCDASILELATTDTVYSEQFLNFIGGWGFKIVAGQPVSSKLDVIRCFTSEPEALAVRGLLKGKPMPVIKVLLMTHTSELAATSDGDHWMEFGTCGHCEQTSGVAAEPLKTTPDTIRKALLGRNFEDHEIIRPGEKLDFFNEVIGIDTAAPEISCFTSATSQDSKGLGMENYKKLVRAAYSASRDRRTAGWHGKLLVHTHVGEGSVTYLLRNVPAGDKAKSVFETFPEIWIDEVTHLPMHEEQARKNIKLLIRAVEELKAEISNLDDYVVFRFGHVTHADWDDALAMKRLQIEADINLESNISTRAFYSEAVSTADPQPLPESQQFEYNDLPGKIINSGHAAEILSKHALKNMLAARVRTLLGSDGGGEENSDIKREYKLAEELISYWRSHDDDFPRDISVSTFYKNAQEHLKDLKEDKKVQ
jgi:hypothetical protein